MTGRPGQTTMLPDGRRLGYAEWGPNEGAVAFAIHGLPGYRATLPVPEDALLAAGVRLITVDRPGVGLSDANPGRTLLSFADDLAVLAEQLGVGPAAVLGWSAGAPFAAACVYTRPETFNRLIVIAGVPPLHGGAYKALPGRPLFALARWFPPALRTALALLRQMARRDPDRTVSRVLARFARPDTPEGEVVRGPELRETWVDLLDVSTRNRGSSWVEDYRLFLKDWGFALEEVRVPTDVWQGEDDIVIPPSAGRVYADAIPAAELHLVPGHGHFIGLVQPEAILARLAG